MKWINDYIDNPHIYENINTTMIMNVDWFKASSCCIKVFSNVKFDELYFYCFQKVLDHNMMMQVIDAIIHATPYKPDESLRSSRRILK